MHPNLDDYAPQLDARLGPHVHQLAHQWRSGGAALWSIWGQRARYALKVHTSKAKFDQERWAYDHWLSKLGPDWRGVPHLVAALDGEPGALLMDWVDGALLSETGDARELAVYHAAGQSLAALHAVEMGEPNAARLRETTRKKTIARAQSLKGVVGDQITRWAIETAEAEAWDAVDIGYCHRDYSPRNWLVGEQAGMVQMTVIDFEFAALDFRPCDVMKLWDGPFKGRPELREAFYAGYGCDEAAHLGALRLLAPSHGLAIVAWSIGAQDEVYLAHGQAFLQRCCAEPDWMLAEWGGPKAD